MNKSIVAVLVFAGLVMAGCTPKVARQPLTETEQNWNDFVKTYYPAWKHEPTVPAAYLPTLPPNRPAPTGLEPARDEALPAMPPAPESDLVFESEVAALDPSATPDAVDVVAIEKVEVVEAVPAESKPAVDAAKPAAQVETSYTVKAGDTLGAIAQKFYGRASMWTSIQKANEKTLKGSATVRPGMVLIIPAK